METHTRAGCKPHRGTPASRTVARPAGSEAARSPRTMREEMVVLTVEIQSLLTQLKRERALAAVEGLDRVRAYMDELEDEIAAVQSAYVCAVVTDIATFRAELSGPQLG